MIVLSIIPDSKEELLKLKAKYPDYFLEYRLDLAKDWGFMDNSTIDEKVILTLRDPLETNREVLPAKSFTLDEKIKFYHNWIANYNCLVDLEFSVLDRLTHVQLISLNPANLIISSHIHNPDWNITEIAQLCLNIERSGCRYGKLAITSDSWMKLVSLETLIKTTSSKILLAVMGNNGVTKRCLYRHLGAEGTYVCLKNKETAGGQLNIELAEKLDLKNLTGNEYIGGILGGAQVLNSIGLLHYNRLFRKKGYKAIYLPFIVDNLPDFASWLNTGDRKQKVYGFSITMPLKKKIAKLAGKLNKIANYWDGATELHNTDLFAMKKLLNRNELLSGNKKILIIGNGATAETILIAIDGKAEVYISSRNFPQALDLARKYKAEYLILENLSGKFFSAVINATPLGMNNENLPDYIGKVYYEVAIDLPYKRGSTPWSKYCTSRNIKYCNGKDFWHDQAEIQENLFLEKLELWTENE
jgi:shikimate 5-dehydrogenase/3-dehydroquinate dehydratase